MSVYRSMMPVLRNYVNAYSYTRSLGRKGMTLHYNNNNIYCAFKRALHSSFVLKNNKTTSDNDVSSSASLPILNKRKTKPTDQRLFVSKEVNSAIVEGKPVVALESAIITHGMPAPQNLITAMKLEEIIRVKGCVPATVGLIRGTLTVGLSAAQLYLLADPHVNRHKISTRDLPFASAKQLNGGTTVSATLLACRIAGIDVFVTGGIGGVHRPASDGAQTWDVSADLVELGHSSGVAVVCSGIKSILDIPSSLEYLETQGVSATVLDPSLPAQVDLSKKVYFPDFFTRSSGVVATSYVSSPEDAARMILNAKKLRLRQGLVFAVPIPEKEEIEGAKIKKTIEEAVALAHTTSVSGRDVTPFVLSEVLRKTGGRSLAANSALIRHNAAVGSDVAIALSKLKGNSTRDVPSSFVPSGLPPSGITPTDVPAPAQGEEEASFIRDPEVRK